MITGLLSQSTAQERASNWELRILLLAPTGNDSKVTARLLTEAGHLVQECRCITQVCDELRKGCGAVVIAEESFAEVSLSPLIDAIRDQPSWSDIPLTIITGRGKATQWRVHGHDVTSLGGNVTLLERPFHGETLLRTVEVALRSRRRQFQVRMLLREQRDSSQLLQNILESISDAFAALDRDWRFIFVNRSFMALVSSQFESPVELLGERLWVKVPEITEAETISFFEHSMASQQPGVFEQYYQPAAKWLEIHAHPSPKMLSIYLRDITARKRAAGEQKKREKRTQLLSETLAQLLGADDCETVVRELFPKVAAHLDVDTYFNFMVDDDSGCLRLHSYTGISDEVAATLNRLEYGQAICGTVALTGEPIVACDIQHSSNERANLVRGLGLQSYACHPLIVRGQLLGTLSFASHTRSAFDLEELEFIRFISQHAAIALDRLRTEQTLRQNAQQLRLAIAAADLGDWSWEAESDMITMSPRAAEIFGVPAGRVMTRSALREQLDEEYREKALLELNRSIETGTDYDIEYKIVRPNGKECWVSAKGRGVYDGAGKLVGMKGMIQDISARKAYETALQEAKEAAEAANRSKDRFLAVLSHELRTPLSPVLMVASSMELDPTLPPSIKNDLAMIRRNVELETKLIDDLLDVSRITSGKLVLRPEPLDVNAAVRQVCQICRSPILEKSIRLEWQLAPQPCWVKADPARFQQVLWNLLNNAIKFTPFEGRIDLTTQVLDDQRVEICVRDSGMGIRADILPHIFGAFEQGDARITGQFGGLGLGLAIAKALVEMHKGTIAAESEGPGLGAVFRVTLPLDVAVQVAAPPAPMAERRVDATRMRLLVVEDHDDTARTLGLLLGRAGFIVTTAGNVASALRHASEESFDIVVSDLGLPDGSGYDLMRQIRERLDLPGIAMSGYGMEEDVRKSREAGFSEHLVKPVSIRLLEQAIHRVLTKECES